MPSRSRRSPLLAFLLLASCAGGGGGSSGSLSVLPRTATVTAGAGTVTFTGAGSATTAADGSFTIPGMRVPYDLAVRAYQSLFVVYLGLRRRDPTAMLYVAGIEDANPAVGLSGQLTGGAGWALPSRTAVGFGSPDNDWLLAWLQLGNAWNAWPLCWSTAGEFGGYAVSCPIAAAQSAVRLTALQWKVDAGGLPQEYTGLGTRDCGTLAADASLDGQHFALGDAPATVHLSGTATTFGADERLAVRARFGDAVLPIAFQEAVTASFQYATPASADELQLTLTQGSTTANPLDEYNVGAYRGGLAVVTARSSFALSELPSLGVSVPSRAACSWSVFATSAASTVDQAAGPQGYLVRTQSYAWGRGVDLAFTSP